MVNFKVNKSSLGSAARQRNFDAKKYKTFSQIRLMV